MVRKVMEVRMVVRAKLHRERSSSCERYDDRTDAEPTFRGLHADKHDTNG